MDELYGGIDIGTTACKLIVVSGEGNVVATASSEYQTSYPKPGWAEQDPHNWIVVVKNCLKKIGQETLKRLVFMSIDAPAHIMVFLDENNQPVRTSLTWEDQRAFQEAKSITAEDDDTVYSISGNRVRAIFALPQLLWIMKNDPESWKKTKRLTFIKDYVRGYLTGEFEYTDFADPIGTLFFDVNKGEWSDYILEKYNIPIEILPAVRNTCEIGGEVSVTTSNEFGLPAGLPIKIGTIDIAADHLVSGVINKGDIMIKLSTVGVISAVTEKPFPRTVNYTLPFRGRWFSKSNTLYAGASYKWARHLFNESSYKNMDSLAEQSPPGSNGLIFHPYLGGEGSPYWKSQLRGSLQGITTTTSRSDVFRAIMEGVGLSLYDSLSEFEGLAIKSARIIGGGASSKLWVQMIADIFQVNIITLKHQDAAYGSAMIAASTNETLESTVNKWVVPNGIFSPNRHRSIIYSEIFKKYKDIAFYLVSHSFE